MKLAQGESNRILLAVPREMWLYREITELGIGYPGPPPSAVASRGHLECQCIFSRARTIGTKPTKYCR
jgi:hypothetical protein